MRTSYGLLLVLLGTFPTVVHAQKPPPLQVLFIGNSYTYQNDLPKMFTELARAGKQRPILTDRETPGGWTFKKHWEGGKALKKIQARQWDVVILQNHSLGALKERDDMFTYGRKLHEAAKKQGARTILYMTWARQNQPEMIQAISTAYSELGKHLKADVAPVGLAWQAALKENADWKLHTQDKSHPTKAGTYLTACVLYATLFDRNPVGLPGKIADLNEQQARQLQEIAWKIVSRDVK